MRLPPRLGAAIAMFAIIASSLAARARAQALPDVPLDESGRARLEASAEAPGLDDWQRDFMRRLAASEASRAGETSLAAAPASAGLASNPADGIWVRLPPPPARTEHSAIYDPIRNRMIVYGGSQNADVWELRLGAKPTWRELLPAGDAPLARYGHSAVYDPVRDRMIIFGGVSNAYGTLHDVWGLSLSGAPAWSRVPAVGDTNWLERFQHSAIYDPIEDRMIIFGGQLTPYTYYSTLSDCRALSLSGTPTWTMLLPDPDPVAGYIRARSEHVAFYDFVRQRMVVYGGRVVVDPYTQPQLSDDVWALSLVGTPAWTQLLPVSASGDSIASQRKRSGHAAAYDALRDRLVVFAGRAENGYYYGGLVDNMTWALDMGSLTWTSLDSTGVLPNPREGHTAIYDVVSDRILVYGTTSSYGGPADPSVWSYSQSDAAGWSKLVAGGEQPPSRVAHTAVYDEARQRVLIFGGQSMTTNAYLNDTWALTLGADPIWSQLNPSGPRPAGRVGHSAVYDRARDRMLIFGGYGGAYRNDVWALSLSGSIAWTRILPTGYPPPSRVDHAAVYDPAGDRMLVFGGFSGIYRDDAWQLSLAGTPAWTQLMPPGEIPSGRYGHSAIWDEPRQRMVAFGGRDALYSLNDVWALTTGGGPAWTRLVDNAPQTAPLRAAANSTEPSAPEPRSHLCAIYDSNRQRMVIYSGRGGSSSYSYALDDAWALPLAGTPAWTMLEPEGSFSLYTPRQAAAYDPRRDRMLVFPGGWEYGENDYALQWSGVVAVLEPGATSALALGIAPNPTRGGARIALDLPRDSEVEATLYDLAGRRLRDVARTRLPAGRHTLEWDGRGAAGEKAPPGVYFVHVRAAGSELTKRIVVLD